MGKEAGMSCQQGWQRRGGEPVTAKEGSREGEGGSGGREEGRGSKREDPWRERDWDVN